MTRALQDTLVVDPFYIEMPLFFDMKFQELIAAKDPHAWPEFERGLITEEELYERFFKDRRPINGPALMQRMVSITQCFLVCRNNEIFGHKYPVGAQQTL